MEKRAESDEADNKNVSDADADEDNSNSCLITEFNNNSIIFEYPEIRISGSVSSINDLKLAVKHLDDVIILDLISTGKSKHLTTFPALNFIQSGKIDKKFSVFGKIFAFVIETSGNNFCYEKPAEEVHGWAHEIEGDEEEILFILTKENFYKLKMI